MVSKNRALKKLTVRFHVSEWHCSHLQELVLHHSPGMRVLLRWVHEVGSTSSKYGASNLPSQIYYCNFIFFDTTQGHPWIALHWRGYVWNPMQSGAFWGSVWSKNKHWSVKTDQHTSHFIYYTPLHLHSFQNGSVLLQLIGHAIYLHFHKSSQKYGFIL